MNKSCTAQRSGAVTLRRPVLAGQFVSHSASHGTLVLSPQQAHP